MSLRLQANLDARMILEDRSGFGWPISITSPSGVRKDVTGFSNDISLVIDPDTGTLVSGREVTIGVSTTTLRLAGFTEDPRGISAGFPWVVEFLDINGTAGRFKVARTSPDLSIGMILLHLEVYEE